MANPDPSRKDSCCSTPASTRTADVWADMGGWTDTRCLLPPKGCLVDLVGPDCKVAVRGRRMQLHCGLDYWRLEDDGALRQIHEMLAWDWIPDTEE